MPEAICCCLQTCKCGFDIRGISVPSLIVAQQVIGMNISLQVLQTCKCGFDIRVVLCISVPSQ